MSQLRNICCPICLSYESVFARSYRAALPGNMEVFSGLSIRTCQECTGSFAYPFPRNEDLTSYYAKDYRAEGSPFRLLHECSQWEGRAVRARSQFQFVYPRRAFGGEAMRIRSWLDIGAGYGFLLDEVKKHGIRKTGAVEHDEHCAIRLKKSRHDVFETLSQVKGPWDVISFSHVLEHFPNPREFLCQVKNLLSDGGRVFCEVPNEPCLQKAKNDAPHLIFFKTPPLSRLFEDIGFKVISAQGCEKLFGGRMTAFQQTIRRLSMKVFSRPPVWVDMALHPHFHYTRQSNRQWIRLLAQVRVS